MEDAGDAAAKIEKEGEKEKVELEMNKTPGAILVFMTGWGDIEKCQTILKADLDEKKFKIQPLHGGISMDQQQEIFDPLPDPTVRRIVLATNIAEASITVSCTMAEFQALITKTVEAAVRQSEQARTLEESELKSWLRGVVDDAFQHSEQRQARAIQHAFQHALQQAEQPPNTASNNPPSRRRRHHEFGTTNELQQGEQQEEMSARTSAVLEPAAAQLAATTNNGVVTAAATLEPIICLPDFARSASGLNQRRRPRRTHGGLIGWGAAPIPD